MPYSDSPAGTRVALLARRGEERDAADDPDQGPGGPAQADLPWHDSTSLIVRFAVATLPAASVAVTVTFAWTFLPSSRSALRTCLICNFVSAQIPVPVYPAG